MKKRSAVLASLVAVGVSLAMATPAQAGTWKVASCSTPGSQFHVQGHSYAAAVSPTQTFWSSTKFTLVGSPGVSVGGKSNMDIYLYQGSTLIASRHSLDNVAINYEYDSTAHPRFYLGEYTNRAYAEHVSFKGTFDVPLSTDPSCVAVTPNI